MDHSPAPPPTNGLAIAGFVLAICGALVVWIPVFGWILGFVPWVLGVIFSAIGLSKARGHETRPRIGLAIAGLAISVGAVLLGILALAGLMAGAAAGA
jgi:hypothetical protein